MDLYFDIKTLFDVLNVLDERSAEFITITDILDSALQLLDLRDLQSTSFLESAFKTQEYLSQHFFKQYCEDAAVIEHVVGHTHIDVAWLWTLAQTREKVIRSFSTVIYLMNKYPEYKFMSSQPQLYDFVKKDFPSLFEKIKEMVRQGRWEPEGSMWVEPDCNVPSGESLVRQILYGKAFFQKEFNKSNEILWLPDVFGYSAALPQIMKKSGIKYFMTSKIAWNDTNIMPDDTFLWEGIDGSKILTHLLTTTDFMHDRTQMKNTTYNGLLNASQIKGAWEKYLNKKESRHVLQLYGYGDGGGGPTYEMLESNRRFSNGIKGFPKTQQSFAKEFFDSLSKDFSKSKQPPTWHGELYLENHRGTYTSMAENKKANRLAEITNSDVEFLASFLKTYNLQKEYPYSLMERNWKKTMLNQFHDILPGTAIAEVYEDSQKDYKDILTTNHAFIQQALEIISAEVAAEKSGVLVLNTIMRRPRVITIPVSKDILGVSYEGKALPSFKENEILTFLAPEIPTKGYICYSFSNKTYNEENPFLWDGINKVLDTPFYHVKFNKLGEILSLFDKSEKREILRENELGNHFVLYEDRPWEYDAWNIEKSYLDKAYYIDSCEEFKITECSPLRVIIQLKKSFLNSYMKQKIIFYQHSKRIDFETTVDWHETNLLLKVEFPVDIHTSKASCDIQFGNVERQIHPNTSWDQAKFELCAHKWVDLSEPGYGIALLNNGKYGHDFLNASLRLTLLKSAVYPNPKADRGLHTFTYALYPHEGDFRNGNVVEEAYDLNHSVYTAEVKKQKGKLPARYSFLQIKKKNVICETLKYAEDGDGIILRLYESWGMRTKSSIEFTKSISEMWECDLLENKISQILSSGDKTFLSFNPYEIKTIFIKY
ncbi:alpha-mannosidase [Salipaludibacillus neizhouensis]|nr:alpha-mannosidase [Salipaludibacillus neizhouensis]